MCTCALMQRKCILFYVLIVLREGSQAQFFCSVKSFNFSMWCGLCPSSVCLWHAKKGSIYAWIIHCCIVNRWVVYNEREKPNFNLIADKSKKSYENCAQRSFLKLEFRKCHIFRKIDKLKLWQAEVIHTIFSTWFSSF